MTNSPKNIFIISPLHNLAYAASEALWHELAVAARKEGWDVGVSVSELARETCQIKRLQSHGVRVSFRHSFGRSGCKRYLQRLQDYCVGSRIILNQIPDSADLICVNLGSLSVAADAAIYRVLKELKSPYVLVIHSAAEIDQYSEKTLSRLRQVLEKAAKVYFVSKRLSDTIGMQLLLDLKNTGIIKNPINLTSRNRLAWPEDDSIRIAMVGRLDAWNKGHIRAMKFLSQSKWKERCWSMSIFGEGPDRGQISQAIRFFGLQDRVFLRGHVNDIAGEIWAKHHVLFMPSFFEGMSLAIVEAMICGRVVVASDVGGAAELIDHGQSGFIAESPFSTQLDKALEELWKRRNELEEIGKKAHERAVDYVPLDAGKAFLDNIAGFDIGRFLG